MYKLFEKRYCMFSAVIPYHKRLEGLSLNIAVNARKCFKLTDFWVTL